MTNQKTATKKDVYEIITSRIIDQLEKGVVPWKKPWIESGIPQNAITKRQYRGINLLLLSSLSYEHNLYLTKTQLDVLGGSIKKDERPELVIFWKWPEEKETEDGKKPKPILRYYTVYNIAQCDGIPDEMIPKDSVKENNPIEICAGIVEFMPKRPEIKHKENRAFYHPFHDFINMPKIEKFDDSESYYDTLFHELVHSTGHHSRLNRKDFAQMKSLGADEYSFEELVAEIGTCMLSSIAGIDIHFDNNVSYINSWLEKLKSDKRFIIDASAKAQKAVDYILNIPQNGVEEKTENVD